MISDERLASIERANTAYLPQTRELCAEVRALRQRAEAAERERDALKGSLTWALQYGTFDVAEDNPMHARALDSARLLTRPASGGAKPPVESKGCHAGKDGECTWPECPQERDGRAHWQPICPLANEDDDDV